MDFGSRIMKIRCNKGISREALALSIGVKPYVLRDIELKGSIPKNIITLLPKLANELNVTLEALVGLKIKNPDLVTKAVLIKCEVEELVAQLHLNEQLSKNEKK